MGLSGYFIILHCRFGRSQCTKSKTNALRLGLVSVLNNFGYRRIDGGSKYCSQKLYSQNAVF